MKTKSILTILLLLIASVARAQESIERLLPLLGSCESLNLRESVYSNDIINNEKIHYNARILATPVEKFPAGVIDNLIAAFEKESACVTESDRYQKHTPMGDTLSYSLISQGTIKPKPNSSKFNTQYHSFSMDMQSAASLDIIDGLVTFHLIQRQLPKYLMKKVPEKDCDAALLVQLFGEIAADSRVKSVPVKYDISNGNYNGSWQMQYESTHITHNKGIRLEVPASIAEDFYVRVSDAITAVLSTRQAYSFSRGYNEISVFFGEDLEGDSFCMKRMDDGRVFILHVEPSPPGTDLAIPWNWYEVDTISRLKK